MIDEPRVTPADRARIARRAVLWSTFPVLVGAVVTAGLVSTDHRAVALGVAIGVATGLLLTATWVVGALVTFHRRGDLLLLATLGLWPVRIIILFLVAALGWYVEAEPFSLVTALFATHVYGHVVEAHALDALARAARRPPAPG